MYNNKPQIVTKFQVDRTSRLGDIANRLVLSTNDIRFRSDHPRLQYLSLREESAIET